MFFPPNSTRLHITCSVNDEYNHFYNQESDMLLDRWYKLTIMQYRKSKEIEDGIINPGTFWHIYEIWIDNKKVHSVINYNARDWTGVSASIGTYWNVPVGRYRNFSFKENNQQPLAHHTINSHINKLFTDQYKMWNSFRDPTNALYCGYATFSGKHGKTCDHDNHGYQGSVFDCKSVLDKVCSI